MVNLHLVLCEKANTQKPSPENNLKKPDKSKHFFVRVWLTVQKDDFLYRP